MKYHNIKTEIDGIKFDSKKEGSRYKELKMLERAGVIRDLCLQPSFLLLPGFKKNGYTFRKTEYIADFKYFDIEKGKWVVEDVKSEITRKDKVYRLKKKLFEYKYKDLEITEI